MSDEKRFLPTAFSNTPPKHIDSRNPEVGVGPVFDELFLKLSVVCEAILVPSWVLHVDAALDAKISTCSDYHRIRTYQAAAVQSP